MVFNERNVLAESKTPLNVVGAVRDFFLSMEHQSQAKDTYQFV